MREMKTPSARSMPLPSRMYSPSVWPGRLTISTKCTEYLGSCKRKQNIGITPRKQTVQPIATLMIPDQHREPARYKTPTFSFRFIDLHECRWIWSINKTAINWLAIYTWAAHVNLTTMQRTTQHEHNHCVAKFIPHANQCLREMTFDSARPQKQNELALPSVLSVSREAPFIIDESIETSWLSSARWAKHSVPVAVNCLKNKRARFIVNISWSGSIQGGETFMSFLSDRYKACIPLHKKWIQIFTPKFRSSASNISLRRRSCRFTFT